MLCIFYILHQVLAQPIFFVAITRHGARSPETFMRWDNQQSWTQGPGMLTDQGLRQEYLLGVYLRERYSKTYKLISEKYTPGEVQIYSSYFNRTQLSAKALAVGLFHGFLVKTGKSIKLPQKSFEFSKYSDNIDFSAVFPVYMHPVTVNPLLLPPIACDELLEYMEKRLSTLEMKKIYLEYDDVINPISVYLTINRKRAKEIFENFYDSVLCNLFAGYEVPEQFKDVWLKRAEELYLKKRIYIRYEPDFLAKYGGSRLLGKILQLMQSIAFGNETGKGVIYSAHDSTIQDVLMGLQMFDGKHSPFASLLLFELFSNGKNGLEVRIMYNGKEVFLPLKKETSSFLEFQTFVSQRIFVDNSGACANIAYLLVAKQAEDVEQGYGRMLFLNFFIMITAVLGINYLVRK